jgi:hypothetical protein
MLLPFAYNQNSRGRCLIMRLVGFLFVVVLGPMCPCKGQGVRVSTSTARKATQVATPRLGLGMPRGEVHKRIGVPGQWWSNAGYLHSLIEYGAAVKVYGAENVNEIYHRRTRSNVYQLNIGYSFDDFESRLNPTLRIWQMLFEADRKTTLMQVLEDIPEAVEVCRKGCVVHSSSWGGNTRLLALAVPSAQQEIMGRLSVHQNETLVTANLSFTWQRGSTALEDWRNQPVTTLQIKMETPLILDEDGVAALKRGRASYLAGPCLSQPSGGLNS